MNLFNKIFNSTKSGASVSVETIPGTIYSPVAGIAITLSEINDGVFSEGILGKGCGIRPSSETICAPFDGTVVQIADTKHAIGITSLDGIELLIHVGVDTVSMNGKGFHVHVSLNDHVKCGQKLLTFSKKEIEAAGFQDTVAVIVTNSDEYQNIDLCASDTINYTEKLMTVK